MYDYDYAGGREDMRSDARAEGGGGRRYRYGCGEGVCGASDCRDCRTDDDEDEVEDEVEEEDEDNELEERDNDDDEEEEEDPATPTE